MKLLLLAIVLALVAATTPTKGDKIVAQLEGVEMDGEIFVILFYDPSCCSDPDRTINNDVKQDLQKKVLSTENGKKYIFYEIDTSDQDMQVVNKKLNIDNYQTKHGPTVLIACSGEGYWAHGRDAADKVAGKMT